MKNTILFSTLCLLFSSPSIADTKCFLIVENNQVIRKEGDCKSRHSPCSTFKIAISLMSFDEGLLIDEMNPELPFEEKYIDWVDNWKQPHNPIKWIKNSCVWYSQILTTKLGMKKFKDYIRKFHYGNQNVFGDKGKNNGLTNSWLSSSLQISPEEQLVFLQKLLANDLPVSKKAHGMTKNILFVEELSDGWKLYGKTGSGSQASKKKNREVESSNRLVCWVGTKR